MAKIKTVAVSAIPILLGSIFSHASFSQEPGNAAQLDPMLNGTGYKIVDYRTESNADVEFREWNHPAWATYVYHDNSFAFLGMSQVPCPDVNVCGSFPLNVVVYARYNASGELISDGVTDAQHVYAGAFTNDGNKFVVSGTASGSSNTIRRFNLDGTPDTSYGDNGVYYDSAGRIPTEAALVHDREGRLLIAHSATAGVSRILPDGTVDSSFGTNGSTGPLFTAQQLPLPIGGWDIAQANDGAYYIALSEQVIVRLTANGQVDTNFGENGILETGSERSHGIAALSDNGVATFVGNYQGTDVRLVRYDSNGNVVAQTEVLNEGDNGDGFRFYGTGQGGSIKELADGKLLISLNWVGVNSSFQTSSRQMIGLFNPDLTPVTDFDGDNGLVTHAILGGFNNSRPATTRDIWHDSEGRFVIIGHSSFDTLDTVGAGYATWAVGRLLGTSDGTPPVDTTPDAFSFSPAENVGVATTVVSDSAQITGIDAPAPVSIVGGDYSIGCGSTFTSAAGSIENGQSICVKHTAATTYSTTMTTTLTVGGISADFVSTTQAEPVGDPDTTPDAFSFESQADVDLYSVVTSNTVAITGFDTATGISVANGYYAINCSGDFISEASELEPGQSVCVQHTAADTCLTDTTTILTIGGVQGAFTSTTVDDSVDSDGDGITDCLDSAPFDAQEAEVALDGGNAIGMTVDDGLFSGITWSDPSNLENLPEDMAFDYGLVSYAVTNLAPGATVQVVLTYPADLAVGTKVYKYNETDGFTEFSNAVISGATITLTLVDGGSGDADGEANGEIIDPVGPAAPVAEEPEPEPEPEAPPASSSSALSWYLLLIGIALAYRRRR